MKLLFPNNLERRFKTKGLLLVYFLFIASYIIPSNRWSINEILIGYAVAPIDITSESPNISWKLASVANNQKQSAYSIQIATDKNLLDQGKANIWDSGKTFSSRSSHIYPAVKLESDTDYWIKVTSWNQDRVASSRISSFSTGFIDEREWEAQWIGLKDGAIDHTDSLLENRSQYLRKEFLPKGKIKRARAFVSGLGFYELSVNGKKVGDHVMAPAKTRYTDRVLYEVFDVKEYLTEEKCALGIHLGNGWYSSNKKYRDWRMPFYGYPEAILQIHIEYVNGEKERIYTDNTWKASYGPIIFNCIFDGESYDARLEMPDWDKPGFDDSLWKQAETMQSPTERLQSHMVQPERIVASIRPVKTLQKENGKTIFDMGQNFSGWTRIAVRGERGAVVIIRHAEKLNIADTTLNTQTNRAAQNRDTYILKGEGVEIYEPRFTFHGFQFAEVSIKGNAELLDAQGRVVHTDATVTSVMETDNKLINHIHHCTMWSQRSNMHGLPLDCPQRDERLGWLADGYVTSDEAILNFDAALFYEKWLDDMMHTQDSLGRLPFISPTKVLEEATNWSCGFILVAWDHYRNYGDMRILKKYYPAMSRYLSYLESISDNYILPSDRYGDWLNPAQDHQKTSGWVRGNPRLSTTAMFYYCTDIAHKWCRLLELKKEEEKYAKLKSSIRNAFNETFFDLPSSTYRGEDYHYQYLQGVPLHFGLTPQAHKAKSIENLIDNIVSRHEGHLYAGIIGAKYIVDFLANEGKNDLIYELVTVKGYPGWDYMTEGLTTLTETWNKGGTLNHVMFGSIDAWFFRSLAGIQTIEGIAGYERFIIQPFFPDKGLYRVSASIQTIKGEISSRWVRNDNQIKLEIMIPTNTEATIKLPVSSHNITINHISLSKRKDIILQEEANICFELGNGNYVLTFQIPE